MPGSGKKKKKRSGSQALGAEDTGSAKESEETSFGDNDEEDLMSPKVFLNDKINVFQQKYPRTLREISTMFNDEDSIMVMISTYEDYENKDEFEGLLCANSPMKLPRMIFLCFIHVMRRSLIFFGVNRPVLVFISGLHGRQYCGRV